MQTLIMWSGGIDSTYILARALRELKDDLVVNHTYLKTFENRQDAEMKAIQALTPKMLDVRNFIPWKIGHDYSDPPTLIYDMPVFCADAGAIAKTFRLNKNLKRIDRWTIGTNAEESHWQTRWDVIVKAANAFAWELDAPQFEFLFPLVSRAEEIRYLKECGIYDDCWFCRTPINNKRCERCPTCHEVSAALKTL